MTRKHGLWVVALTLALLNGVYWWPTSAAPVQVGVNQSERDPMVAIADLRFAERLARTRGESAAAGNSRDIFSMATPTNRIPVMPAQAVEEPEPSTPVDMEQMRREQALMILKRVNVEAVLFRGGVGKAFVSVDDQYRNVEEGVVLENRVVVERLTAEKVILRDKVTNTVRVIELDV